jgi:pimeloyl-ACP methyl ester carboxylesterase
VKEQKKTLFFFLLALALSCPNVVNSSPDYSKNPVLFVHGHGMFAGCWSAMVSYLTKFGYPDIYLRAIQLMPNDGPNIVAAEEQIAPAVEQFLEEINSFLSAGHSDISVKTKVDLVSHSMGSMSSRWYAARVRPDRVRVWISLGGANHGSDALCGFPDLGAEDLCPAYAESEKESCVQYVLNGAPYCPDVDETPYGMGDDAPGVDRIRPAHGGKIFYVTLRTSPDKWVKPENSVVLDGCGGVDQMLSDPQVMALVRVILGIPFPDK